MSGSNGSRNIGSSSTDDVISCDVLRFETQIASPNPAVVPTLKIGDELSIIIAASSRTQEIQVITAGGDLVGGLLAAKVQRMRECMLESHSYKAKVLSIIGGQVRVFVEHA